ncbi:MAG: hypothetical protein IIC31_00870 [Chloroflexi bacterium]|nr:hypothetical protein [Chloroflexota bacterium]
MDTDDGRRHKRGYARSRVQGVDIYVADRLSLYAVWAQVDVKRSIFGRRLFIDFEHRPELECPE